MKASGWNFQRIDTMGICFYISGELKGSSFVNVPLRSSAILNNKIDDMYCFIWSIVARLHPCEVNSIRVSSYEQYFFEKNFNGFDFSNRYKSSDMHRFEKLDNLSINIFELNFYQEQNKWKHKLIPIDFSKKESDRVLDLLIYKSHYVLIKKLTAFLGKQGCRFLCKRCLNSYASENMIIKHKQQSFQKQLTSIKASPESHLNWKSPFHKNLLYFNIYADFEADNAKEDSKAGCNKTTKIFRHIRVCNSYENLSELEDVIIRGYHKSPLGYENIDWFVAEIINFEIEMTFCFKNTTKDTIMT